MVRKSERFIAVLFLFTVISISLVQAQRLCESIVENAFVQAGENCQLLDGEISCYAYDSLRSTFHANVESAQFVAPGSIVELNSLHTIESASVDLEEDEWGIAYLQAQLNLDDSPTPESAVRLIMLGDVFMENAIEGVESTVSAVGSVYVTTSVASPLRATPAEDGESIAEGTAAMVLVANAQTADGAWVAVDFEGQPAWLSRDVLFANEAIDSLPVAGESTSASSSAKAFQNLYFVTGGDSDCQEAPNMLIVQGPDGKAVDININDVPIRIGSTIALGNAVEDGSDVMYIAVISGKATLYPDTPEAVEIPAGSVSYAPLSPIAGVGVTAILDEVTGAPIMSPAGIPYVRRVPNESFSEPEPMNEEETGFRSQANYKTLSLVPDTFLNYPLNNTVTETTCTIKAKAGITSLEGHVGPGRGRSVRTILETSESYVSIEETNADDGSLWYGVDTGALGIVYVPAEDMDTICETVTREVRTECILEPRDDIDELWGHVGPGINRSVTNFLDLNQSYTPIGNSLVEGVPWFEVALSASTNVWVDGSRFKDIEGCGGDESAPVVKPTVTNNQAPLITFTPAPAGFVPTEGAVIPTEEVFSPLATEELIFLTEEPVFPTEEPVFPTEEPVFPTEEPVIPTEEPVFPTDVPPFGASITACNYVDANFHSLDFSFYGVPPGVDQVIFLFAEPGAISAFSNPKTGYYALTNDLPIHTVRALSGGSVVATGFVGGLPCP